MRHQWWPPQILGTWQGGWVTFTELGEAGRGTEIKCSILDTIIWEVRKPSKGDIRLELRRKVGAYSILGIICTNPESRWGCLAKQGWKRRGLKSDPRKTPVFRRQAGNGFMQKWLWRSCQMCLRKARRKWYHGSQEKRIFQEGGSNPLCQMLLSDYYLR